MVKQENYEEVLEKLWAIRDNNKSYFFEYGKYHLRNFILSSIYEKLPEIESIITVYYNLSRIDLESSSHKREIVECRWLIWHFSYRRWITTTITLGKLYNKDYSTVIYGLNMVKILINRDKEFTEKYQNVKKLLELN